MILNCISKTLCTAAIAGLSAVLPANAAVISGVINSSGPGSGTLTETFNQSGLSAGYTSSVTNCDTFVATTTHKTIFLGYE